MSDEIKPGSTVQLKSGGPVMTVRNVGHYNGELGAFCEWFPEKSTKPEGKAFLMPMLKLVE